MDISNGSWIDEFRRRLKTSNFFMYGVGAALVPVFVLWLRKALDAPSVAIILAFPALAILYVVSCRVMLGWVVAAAPVEIRKKHSASRQWRMAYSVGVYAVAIASLWTQSDLRMRAVVLSGIIIFGEVAGSTLFKLHEFIWLSVTKKV